MPRTDPATRRRQLAATLRRLAGLHPDPAHRHHLQDTARRLEHTTR